MKNWLLVLPLSEITAADTLGFRVVSFLHRGFIARGPGGRRRARPVWCSGAAAVTALALILSPGLARAQQDPPEAFPGITMRAPGAATTPADSAKALAQRKDVANAKLPPNSEGVTRPGRSRAPGERPLDPKDASQAEPSAPATQAMPEVKPAEPRKERP
jgi:hypothetical protein